MTDTFSRLAAGAAAGFAATGPMTAVMEFLHRLLPPEQQHPQPPRQITDRSAEAVDLHDDLTEEQKSAAAMANHFGYGTSVGAVYGLLAPHLPFSPPANGVAYAMGVWAGSYLGWLPAAGLYPSATDETAERNAVILAAHVVWGATLGAVHADLAGRDRRPDAGRLAPPAPLAAGVTGG